MELVSITRITGIDLNDIDKNGILCQREFSIRIQEKHSAKGVLI